MTTISISLKTVSITRDTAEILHNITANLSNQQGGMIGLVGPNGAGKSTLLSAMAGLLKPAVGTITYAKDGQTHTDLSPAQRASLISYLPQSRPVHWAMSVENIVRLGRYGYGGSLSDHGGQNRHHDDAIHSAMALAGVTAFRDHLITKLSGGEQSRVHLARALSAQAPILLADEPTNALDPEHQFLMMKTLAAYAGAGRLVITALHDLSLAARFCDQLLVLDHGKLSASTRPKNALSPQCLHDIFKVSGSWVQAQNDEENETLILAPL